MGIPSASLYAAEDQLKVLLPDELLTFHVSLPLVYNECVAMTLAFTIFDDSYTFYRSVHLELAPQVGLCGLL